MPTSAPITGAAIRSYEVVSRGRTIGRVSAVIRLNSNLPKQLAKQVSLPARLQLGLVRGNELIGVGPVQESIDVLRELGILVDGSKRGEYMLQIFLKEAAGLYHDREAGPFFFEIIQRKGDRGFGAGNFRALFEAIEREQARGKGGDGATVPRM